MTIQVAVANSHGVAMASDRHVFRDGAGRSTGRDTKLLRLRGLVPAAMMASGPLAVFDLPVSRLALTLERAIAEVSANPSPEALAQAVLDGVAGPLLPAAAESAFENADATVLGTIAEQVLGRAETIGQGPAAVEQVLAEIRATRPCRNGAIANEAAKAAWQVHAAQLAEALPKPGHAPFMAEAPSLCGEAVAAALTHDWRHPSSLYLTVGLCCPATGVPLLVALRLWKGLGRRLLFVSRFQQDFEALWRSNRTVLIAQGAGRPIVEAMIDGIADEHWRRIPEEGRQDAGARMNARWDRTHDRVAVSSVAELGAIATGLVRGAEVIGYLTREAEGTIAAVDCVHLTPRGSTSSTLAPTGDSISPSQQAEAHDFLCC